MAPEGVSLSEMYVNPEDRPQPGWTRQRVTVPVTDPCDLGRSAAVPPCVASGAQRATRSKIPFAGMVLIRTADKPLVPYPPGLSRGVAAAADTPIGASPSVMLSFQ